MEKPLIAMGDRHRGERPSSARESGESSELGAGFGGPGRECLCDATGSVPVEVVIPFDSAKSPGVAGRLRFVLSPWNEDAEAAG